MQPLEAGLGETSRLRRRVGVEDGRPRHVAPLEADALAVLQVDGGEEDHQGATVFPGGGGTRDSCVLPAPSPRRKPGPIAPGLEGAKTAEQGIPAFAGMTDGLAPKVEELTAST